MEDRIEKRKKGFYQESMGEMAVVMRPGASGIVGQVGAVLCPADPTDFSNPSYPCFSHMASPTQLLNLLLPSTYSTCILYHSTSSTLIPEVNGSKVNQVLNFLGKKNLSISPHEKQIQQFLGNRPL